MSFEVIDHEVEPSGAAQLKRSELVLLALVSRGMTNREIANDLATSVAVVKWRTSEIFTKLSVKNRVQAVARARHLLDATPSETPGFAPGPMPERLREVEVEILRLIGAGMTRSEIADRLALAQGTVAWYLTEIFGKLQVRNRVEALARARQMRWL
jgi:DNA-binding NarL/FixJ family response regulator